MRTPVAATLALLAVLPANSVIAQDDQQLWTVCINKYDKLGRDAQVAACTTIIQAGRESQTDTGIAFLNRGRGYADLGQDDKAMADYEQAIRRNPTDIAGFINRGNVYRRRGELDRAIQDYDTAIRLNSRSHSGFTSRGHAYIAKRQFDLAIRDFDETIRLGYHFGFFDRCIAKIGSGELAGALDDCNHSIREMPSMHWAIEARGLTYFKLGHLDSALADYEASLKIDPRSAFALFGRGILRRQRGKITEGDADIAAALAILPEIAEQFAILGVRP